jgi:hypothetical protein
VFNVLAELARAVFVALFLHLVSDLSEFEGVVTIPWEGIEEGFEGGLVLS